MSCLKIAIFQFTKLSLSPTIGRRPWSGDYKKPSVRASIRSSRFYINLNISFDIFIIFAGNVYGYVIILKGLISPLPLLLGVWDVKTICRKSRPWNISQVLNLTFNPCFKVKWGHHNKVPLYLPYYWC